MAMKLATLLTMKRPVALFAKKVIPILGKDFKLFAVEKNDECSQFIICFTEYFWVEIFPQYLISTNPNYILPEYQYIVKTYKDIKNYGYLNYSLVRDLGSVLQEIKTELKPKQKRFWHCFRFLFFVKNSVRWKYAREDKVVPTKRNP